MIGTPPPPLARSAAIKEIIAKIEASAGLPPGIIVSRRRTHRVVAARWRAINEVHAAFPEIGYAPLGRFFNKNHATIMFALGRIKKRAAQGGPDPSKSETS